MTTARILSALLIAGLAAPVVCADDEKPKKPGEPAKPIIIQLDASKLPPELLKLAKQANEPAKPEKPALPEKPAIKPGVFVKPTKTIGLAEAIAIAEKTSQGTALRAERKGEGADARFVIEIESKSGRSSVAVDGSGKVTGDKKGDPGDKKKEEKGETGSKTKDKEENEDKKQKKQEDDDDKRGKKPANNKEKKGD
jgi:ribonuclease E